MRGPVVSLLVLLVLAAAAPMMAASANFQASCVSAGSNVFCTLDASRYYFLYPPTSCAPASINNYYWTFGDGSYRTTANPVTTHVYPSTTRDVTITLYVYCTDETSATISYSYYPPIGIVSAVYPDCGWNPPCASPPS